jgi:hypothetical protein
MEFRDGQKAFPSTTWKREKRKTGMRSASSPGSLTQGGYSFGVTRTDFSDNL